MIQSFNFESICAYTVVAPTGSAIEPVLLIFDAC